MPCIFHIASKRLRATSDTARDWPVCNLIIPTCGAHTHSIIIIIDLFSYQFRKKHPYTKGLNLIPINFHIIYLFSWENPLRYQRVSSYYGICFRGCVSLLLTKNLRVFPCTPSMAPSVTDQRAAASTHLKGTSHTPLRRQCHARCTYHANQPMKPTSGGEKAAIFSTYASLSKQQLVQARQPPKPLLFRRVGWE